MTPLVVPARQQHYQGYAGSSSRFRHPTPPPGGVTHTVLAKKKSSTPAVGGDDIPGGPRRMITSGIYTPMSNGINSGVETPAPIVSMEAPSITPMSELDGKYAQ